MNWLSRIPMFAPHNSTRLRMNSKIFHQYFMPLASCIQQNNLTTSQKVWQSYRRLEPLGCSNMNLSEVRSIRNKAVFSQLVQKLFHQPDPQLTKRQLHVSSYCHGASEIPKQSSTASEAGEKVNLERLTKVQELMTLQIPVILSQRHEYRIYTADVILQNNWDVNNIRQTVGIGAYVMAVVKARFYVHSNYAKVKVSVLGSSIDEVSGTVQVNWRISYLPQAKAFMFWKYKPLKFRTTANQLSESVDGVSTFYVNNKGFIYKHVLTRAGVEKSTENGPC